MHNRILEEFGITMRIVLGTLLAVLIGTFPAGVAGAAFASPGMSSNEQPLAIVAKKGTGLSFDNKAISVDVSKPYGSHLEPILMRIKASSDQRIKITQIVMSYRSSIQPLRDQYKVKRDQFIKYMVSGSTAELIMSRQLELGHLSSDMSSKYTLMRLEIRRLLSPEQVLLFEQYAREHGWNH